LNPFEYVNAINNSKKDIMVDDLAEKAYAPFTVNRSLSYFADTVLVANEMNKLHHIDNKLQFSFLLNIVRKRKRFSKWAKAEQVSDVDVVKEYYGYNDEQARQVLPLLSNDQLSVLKEKVYKGGKVARRK
jgi:hypothetical protein